MYKIHNDMLHIIHQDPSRDCYWKNGQRTPVARLSRQLHLCSATRLRLRQLRGGGESGWRGRIFQSALKAVFCSFIFLSSVPMLLVIEISEKNCFLRLENGFFSQLLPHIVYFSRFHTDISCNNHLNGMLSSFSSPHFGRLRSTSFHTSAFIANKMLDTIMLPVHIMDFKTVGTWEQCSVKYTDEVSDTGCRKSLRV